MIGKTLLHYEIVEKLGQGGMGEVYRARDQMRYAFKALERDPTNPSFLFSITFSYLNLDDLESARKWLRRLEGAEGGEIWALFAAASVASYEDKHSEAARTMRMISEQFPLAAPDWLACFEVVDGNPQAARNAMSAAVDGLFEADFEVTTSNLANAVTSCFILRAEGKDREAAERAAAIDAFLATRSEDDLRSANYVVPHVVSHAFQKRFDEAFEALEHVIADGHLERWWDTCSFMHHELKDDPRWQQGIDEIRAIVARQRATLAAEGLANP